MTTLPNTDSLKSNYHSPHFNFPWFCHKKKHCFAALRAHLDSLMVRFSFTRDCGSIPHQDLTVSNCFLPLQNLFSADQKLLFIYLIIIITITITITVCFDASNFLYDRSFSTISHVSLLRHVFCNSPHFHFSDYVAPTLHFDVFNCW